MLLAAAKAGKTATDAAGAPNTAPGGQTPSGQQDGSPQTVDQKASIEEQRRQWEFDKGIDSRPRRDRQWPAKGEVLSDYQLSRKHPKYGDMRPHRALDIRNPEGDPVKAAGNGTVKGVGSHGDLGNHVMVDYEDGRRGVYGHTAPSVKPGQKVRAGDPIGNTDLSGSSTGAHVHYEVHDPKTGQKMDPKDHLPHRLK